MSRCTPEVLETYFRDYGWTIRPHGRDHWLTGWQGDSRSYPLKVSLCDTWISFHIEPFLKIDIDWEAWPELLHCLLELNQNSHMVKLSINDAGDIGLSLELFTRSFSFSDFSDALGVLAYYAEQFYDRIQLELDELGYHEVHTSKLLT